MPDLLEQLRQALADRYAIERELGAGGMATVYLARDLKHDRPVALKVLRPELAASLGGERFLREIRVTAKLNHPHILPLLDSGEEGGFLFYVMPYMEGESLRERLERERQLPLDEALTLTLQVASALDCAHQQGIVHRDIKPENILLSRGEAVVADFGIALAVKAAAGERLTQTGLSLGTPQYMSPEQATGAREVDARSDLYSLAAVLYEMLVGEPPHTGATAEATLAKLLTQAPTPPRVIRTAIPDGVNQAVLKALAKQPVDRFGSVRAFAEALTLDATGAESGKKSIVVLPFANLSPDPENEYFADGLTEEIITDLSQVRSLLVISRNSAMQLKHTTKGTRAIGRELNVRYVLEGSVRRAGNSLRITAQLVDATTDAHLWADKFTGKLDDVFDAQESVSRSIVDALQVKLSPEESRRVETRLAGGSLAAYELYLLGLHHVAQLSREHLDSAVQHFTRAVEVQPDFARAYAGLADSYMLMTQGAGVPPLEAFPKARAAAEQALELDPLLAEAHASLGGIRLFFDWDWARAEAALRRAAELNPNYGQAHHWLAFAHLVNGRHADALEEMRWALALDPLSPYANVNMGWILYAARDFDGSCRHMSKALEALPDSPGVRFMLGVAQLGKGDLEEAIVQLERSREVSGGGFIMALPYLGLAYARAGRAEDARDLLRVMERLAHRQFVSPDYLALVHVGLGDYEQAFNALEQACEQRTDWPVWFPADPLIDPIRTHPRFVGLLNRVGISVQPWATSKAAVPATTPPVEAEAKSIVVLPFQNLSPDPDNAFFADGLTEEVIAALSRVRALRVISRTSAMHYKGTTKTLPSVAAELSVRYVLEGSVRRAGNDLRITAQLIDAATDVHLWAETFTGTLEDVFDLQERLARRIVGALEVTLAPEEDGRLAHRPVPDVRAYDAWLRAREAAVGFTVDGLMRAFELIDHGLAIVGDNALLYATQSWLHMISYTHLREPAGDPLARAEALAARALALEPDLPWARYAMGTVLLRRGDLQGFVHAARRALELERDSHTLMGLGTYLAEAGRTDDARRYADEALALDPLTWYKWSARALPDLLDGRFAEAIARYRESLTRLAIREGYPVLMLADALAFAGQEDEAAVLFARAHEDRRSPWSDFGVLFGHALRGDRRAVTELLGTPDLPRIGRAHGFSAILIASCLARVGDCAGALEWVELGIGHGFTHHRFLGEHNRFLAPLRGNPRFQALMERAREKERSFEV